MKKITSVLLCLAILCAYAVFAVGSGSDDASVSSDDGSTQSTAPSETYVRVKPGEVLTANDLKITYVSCEEFKGYNQYAGPKEGNKIIKLSLNVENTGSVDRYISTFEFKCYADNAQADDYIYGDDNLSATLSAGRTAKGNVYFEVPKDAEKIEVEYETDFWSSGKAIFEVNL